MPGFESIIDQKQPIGILTTLLRNENIPHALLFTGIEGVGKHTAAITFAMACNCAGLDSGQLKYGTDKKDAGLHTEKQLASLIPCGCCRSCKKIKSDNHPDIIWIKPSGPFIKIDQIRTLYQILSMKPYEARYRVVIVSDAQRMNPSASNAFLKMLEEPPDRTVLILIAEQKSDLLQTVVSRCQHIQFNPISRNNLAAMLTEKEGVNSKDAIIIATMANGSFSKAREMGRSDWISQRNWLINTIGLDQPNCPASKRTSTLLSLSALLVNNKQIIEDSLETIKSWLRDLIIYKYRPEKIVNKDLEDKIKRVSKNVKMKSLLRKIEAVQSTQLDIRRANTNLRLALDLLILKLSETAN